MFQSKILYENIPGCLYNIAVNTDVLAIASFGLWRLRLVACLTGSNPMPRSKRKSPGKAASKASIRVAQQVRLPDIVRKALKRLAGRDGIHLGDTYDDALRWFLKHEGRRKTILYLASSHAGGYATMWLDRALLDRIRVVAERDQVPINRVTYTALVHYLQSRNML